jgi:hypothetical protein
MWKGMGCMERKRTRTGRKNLSYPTCILIPVVCVVMLGSIFGIMIPLVGGTGYTPAPPFGPNLGYVNIDYPYQIITINRNASWMFDWGDGETTPWLILENSSTTIVQTHRWTYQGNYTVRIKFKNTMYPDGIWSDPLLVSISYPTITDYPSEPGLRIGTVEGLPGTLYMYTINATDPHGHRVQYRVDFGDGSLSNWTSLVPSGGQSVFAHRWVNPGSYPVIFQACNEFQLHSSWSSPVFITIQNDSANMTSCKDLLVIAGGTDFITYAASNHIGTFTNTTLGGSNDIHWNGEGMYLIDDDMDGKWDYEYMPAAGLLQVIPPVVVVQNQPGMLQLPWLWIFIIVGIVVGVIVTIFVLIKKGYIYFYEEEVVEK